MRYFEGWLVLVISAMLWMLPTSEAIYNFRTDIREDAFTVFTQAGQTTATLVLVRAVFEDDSQTISVSSNVSDDLPALVSYTPANRAVAISGLIESESHRITIVYYVDALRAHSAINTFMGWLPSIWALILFVYPAAAITVMVMRWRR